MSASLPVSLRRLTATALCVVAIACGSSNFTNPDKSGGEDPDSGASPGGQDDSGEPLPDATPVDDGSTTGGDASSDGGSSDVVSSDAPVDAPNDAPPCTTPLGPGVLVIEEMMVAAISGSNDVGEWVEIRNTAPCRVNLKGLHAASPRGTTAFDTIDVATDTFVASGQRFILADSTKASDNGGLPGLVLQWVGATNPPTDVLKNAGDTITLSVGATQIDSIVYDTTTFALVPGTSYEFSTTCPAVNRTVFTNWNYATRSWNSFFATPAAANDDVSGC